MATKKKEDTKKKGGKEKDAEKEAKRKTLPGNHQAHQYR